MKAALISLGSKSSLMTVEALHNYFDDVENVSLKDVEVSLGLSRKPSVLYKGRPLKNFDCVYIKGSFRYSTILRSIAESLQDETYLPIHSSAYTLGHDKILTHLLLQQHNIPMPTTYLASSAKAAKNILTEVNYPIILKFPHGTQGIGVMVAESFASASSMLDALLALRQPFLIQEYIDTSGVDVRAFVVGNRVVAGVKRTSKRGELRANVHAGATGEPYNLDTFSRRVAIDAAKAIGADICAIDLLEGPKGPLVIEVNLSPGLQGITEVTGVNVADKIAKSLHDSAVAYKQAGSTQQTDQLLEDLGITEKKSQQIVTHLDFRADRILLPKVVTELTGFTEEDEFVVKINKQSVSLELVK